MRCFCMMSYLFFFFRHATRQLHCHLRQCAQVVVVVEGGIEVVVVACGWDRRVGFADVCYRQGWLGHKPQL